MKVYVAKQSYCCTHNSNCITDKCMAWRWNIEEVPEEERDNSLSSKTLQNMLFNVPPVRFSTDDGYCGLAGKECSIS